MAKEVSNIIEFTLIYNRYKIKLFNYVNKMVNNTSYAEDIIQSVFLRFYENMPKINKSDSHEFWLFKSARNEVYNLYRSKKVRSGLFNEIDFEYLPADEKESTEYLYDQKEMHSLIMKELHAFPIDQRETYLLKEYSGLSYKEIAILMDIDGELVKSRLFKVRRKLAERISKTLLFGV